MRGSFERVDTVRLVLDMLIPDWERGEGRRKGVGRPEPALDSDQPSLHIPLGVRCWELQEDSVRDGAQGTARAEFKDLFSPWHLSWEFQKDKRKSQRSWEMIQDKVMMREKRRVWENGSAVSNAETNGSKKAAGFRVGRAQEPGPQFCMLYWHRRHIAKGCRVTEIFATHSTVKELIVLHREFLGILRGPTM